jgi:short-subunit dehydrogenase
MKLRSKPVEIHGRVALVTGAAGGIGSHICRALAREGVILILSGRNLQALNALKDELRDLGAEVAVVTADLADSAARSSLIDRAESVYGPLDLLINNAGIELASAYSAMSFAEVESILEVNLHAPMHLTHQVLPRMHARGHGHVVNIGSLAAYIRIAYMQTYCASKSGLQGFTGAMRAEYAGTGVSLSFVACGYVDAGIYAPIADAGLKVSPLAGISKPETVARAVIEAIRRDQPEVIVNPTPLRPLIVLGVVAPRFLAKISRILKTDAAFRALAAERGRSLTSAGPSDTADQS